MTTTAPTGLVLTPEPNATLHGLKAPALTPPDSEDTGGGILNNLTDFVELDLADDDDGAHGPTPPSPPPPRGRSASVLSTATTRDLTHAAPPRAGAVPAAPPTSHHLAAPSRRSRSKKPHPSSASTPSLAGGTRRARSAQPPIPARSTSALGPPRSPATARRTSTWGRRSSKEIEAEYDSDDEVPADTIFHNIPLSPRSARALSASTSPERKLSGESAGDDQKEPSAPASPGDTRSKSWTDLSDEVKQLTEKLEEFEAGGVVERPARRSSAAASNPPRDSIRSAKSSAESRRQELPAVPNLNGFIDPLPMSKEKEAVLSRTRPSWLPPKSKDEEKRHLKEYQRMMRRSQDTERKRAEKARQELEARERAAAQQSTLWETRILPDFTHATRDPRTRELWWRGIPPRTRAAAWKLAIGNPLSLTAESYRHALTRATALRSSLTTTPTPTTRALFAAIDRDAAAAFPALRIFSHTGPLHESLRDVLAAYTQYRSDVGYVHGTHHVAAVLLLTLPAADAFVALANLLNRPLPLAFHTQDAGGIERSHALFLRALRYRLPKLHAHLHETLRIPPAEYLEPMWLSLFAGVVSVDVVQRLWDVYVFEGDAFLVRAAVGVLGLLESRLYGTREEVLAVLGWGGGAWELGGEEGVMAAVRAAGKEERGERGA